MASIATFPLFFHLKLLNLGKTHLLHHHKLPRSSPKNRQMDQFTSVVNHRIECLNLWACRGGLVCAATRGRRLFYFKVSFLLDLQSLRKWPGFRPLKQALQSLESWFVLLQCLHALLLLSCSFVFWRWLLEPSFRFWLSDLRKFVLPRSCGDWNLTERMLLVESLLRERDRFMFLFSLEPGCTWVLCSCHFAKIWLNKRTISSKVSFDVPRATRLTLCVTAEIPFSISKNALSSIAAVKASSAVWGFAFRSSHRRVVAESFYKRGQDHWVYHFRQITIGAPGKGADIAEERCHILLWLLLRSFKTCFQNVAIGCVILSERLNQQLKICLLFER